MSQIVPLNKFYKVLKDLGYEWHFVKRGEIQLKNDSSKCPYVAVVQQGDYDINERFRNQLFRAADNKPGHNTKIRQKLLEACGLEEWKESEGDN